MGRNLGPRSVSVGSRVEQSAYLANLFRDSMTNVSGCDARDRRSTPVGAPVEKLDDVKKDHHPVSRDTG